MNNRNRMRSAYALIIGLLLPLLTVTSSSAASLGAVEAALLGSASAQNNTVGAIELDWSPAGLAGSDHFPGPVLASRVDGKNFSAGDQLEITISNDGPTHCSAAASAPEPAPEVEVRFEDCALPVWEVERVAVQVSNAGQTMSSTGSLGPVLGGLSAYSGRVLDPSAAGETGTVLGHYQGIRTLESVFAQVSSIQPGELGGASVIIVLLDDAGRPGRTFASALGTKASHDGAWFEPLAEGDGSGAKIVADVSALAGGTAPPVDGGKYRIVVLTSQVLGGESGDARAHGILTFTGDIEPVRPGPPVSNATVPVNLDPRLAYSEPEGPVQLTDPTELAYCYQFTVTNSTDEPVKWSVTFDTSLPPMWGVDPTANFGGPGTLTQFWSARTISYDPATSLWTVGGEDWNAVLAPGEDTTAGYCSLAEIPPADPTTFNPPEFSVHPDSHPHHVALNVRVTSSSPWYVPWEGVIDLADLVCPDTLPEHLSGENATLTHLEGTKYLVRGTESQARRFVSADDPRDFVFLRYNLDGAPFLPGECS